MTYPHPDPLPRGEGNSDPSDARRTLALPLASVRVLDLTHHIAGPYCTKFLASLGAEVIKIERPGSGDRARGVPPFFHDDPHLEKSGLFLYLNTGKKSVTLDLKSAEGRDTARRLAAGSHIVVENFRPGTLDRLGLGYDTLAGSNPALVLTSISNFGQTGPYRDFEATEINLFAMGGQAYIVGFEQREPLKFGGHAAQFMGGIAGFTATMMAFHHAEATGEGQHVDVSIMEAMNCSHARTYLQYLYLGNILKRSRTMMIFPCLDGYVGTSTRAREFVRMLKLIGRPDLVDDARFSTDVARRHHADELEAEVIPWMIDRTKEEIYHTGQRAGLTFGCFNNIDEALRSPQYQARGFAQPVEHPVVGTLPLPGLPFRWEELPRQEERAPLLGEHNDEVLSLESRVSSQGAGDKRPETRDQRLAGRALAGIRVLDMGMLWAGPAAGQLLADFGAQVIKIESCRHPDRLRWDAVGLFPDNVRGERWWNRSGMIHERNRNKYGVTVDLSTPAGVELFQQLVRISDVILENFRVRVMRNFGLDFETLRQVNPGIIQISISSQGLTGPECEYGSNGNTLEQIGGQASLTGYPDEPPYYSSIVLPDALAANLAPGVVLAALRYRRLTGQGVHVDFSQRELSSHILGAALMDYVMNGRVQGPMGNAHPTFAPHGCYRCRGEDGWVTIAVRTDAQWAALCAVLGRSEWADDPRYATAPARHANQAAIDEAISAWTAGQDHYEVMLRLQKVGVPSAPVPTIKEVLEDPHLRERGFFETVTDPEVGTYPYYSRPMKLPRTPGGTRSHAPHLGQHNRFVLGDLLGLSHHELAGLEQAGIIGTMTTMPRYE